MTFISFGKATVVTHAVPVQMVALANQKAVHRVFVTVPHINTGRIFIGLKGMNQATGAGVLVELGIPPATGPLPYWEMGLENPDKGVSVGELWIDSTVDGEGAFIAAIIG